MSEDFSARSMWPYYAVLLLCAGQAWRPTLLVWCVLITMFLAALASVISAENASTGERCVLAVLIALPILGLWYFRPQT
jgi:hypothetical protein